MENIKVLLKDAVILADFACTMLTNVTGKVSLADGI